jgi:hypothetical protein
VIYNEITITDKGLAAGLTHFIESLRPGDLPRIEKAARGLSSLHAVFVQILDGKALPVPPSADTSALEKRLTALQAHVENSDALYEAVADELAKLADLRTIVEGLGARACDAASAEAAKVEVLPVDSVAGAAEPSANGNGKPHADATEIENRLAIAKALANFRFPLTPTAISKEVGLPLESVREIIACEWFERVKRKGPAVYRLTDAGRTASVAAPASARPIAETDLAGSRDPAALRSMEQAKRLAGVLAASTVPMTVEAVAKESGLPLEVAAKRLRYYGPDAVNNSVLRYFMRDGALWWLSGPGKELAAEGKAVAP